jgi:uncharacterized lipoprotein YmbA
MRRRSLLLGTMTLAGALAGCTGASIQNYQLVAVPGAVRGGNGLRVGVRSIGVPASLAQASLPMPGSQYRVNSFANDQWAGSLPAQLQGTMVQNLAQRLPGDIVLASGGSIGTAPDIYVEINVLLFSPDASGNITLQAQLATRHASAQDWQLQNFRNSAAGGNTPDGIAAAMSALWGQAADTVAGMIPQT